MKKLLAIALLFVGAAAYSEQNVDVYDIQLNLDIPRVYSNTQSTGYRRYQRQRIIGKMYLEYGEQDEISLSFSTFTNLTYLISDKYVTYEVEHDADQLYNFSWCGSNKTGKFTKPNCNFSIILEPSYKVGSEMLDDLHLTIVCTKGSKAKIGQVQVAYRLYGYAAGQLGCNCKAWGHISPTRQWALLFPLSEYVTDIASVSGIAKLKYNKKESRSGD